MRGCGTVFNAGEKETLQQLELIAKQFELQAYNIRCAIEYAIRNETTKGLSDMVAFSFSTAQHTPQYGGSSGLPAGKYKGVIVNSSLENVEKNGQIVGGYMLLELTPIEGPLQGQKQADRLNLNHVNPKTVEIANKQLSAYCHVLNVHNMTATEQLHNIPFWFEVGPQKNDPQYTEIKGIWDINGNEPGKAGAGPQANTAPPPSAPPAGAPPAGVAATGGWGGAPATPAADPNAGQPNGGGWGGQQPQQQNNAAPGGWQQNGAAPAGSPPPGWGPR